APAAAPAPAETSARARRDRALPQRGQRQRRQPPPPAAASQRPRRETPPDAPQPPPPARAPSGARGPRARPSPPPAPPRGDRRRSGANAPSTAPRSPPPREDRPSGVQLLDRALARRLVVAPALDLGAVADAPAADVVEGHLDHELGAELDPLELAPVGPARRLAGSALARLVGLQPLDERALLARGEAAGVPDLAQLAAGVVEPEDDRADGPLALARPPPDDDAVDRPDALDLDHARALSRAVGAVELLGDHALGLAQPRLGVVALAGARRQLNARGDAGLQARPALWG